MVNPSLMRRFPQRTPAPISAPVSDGVDWDAVFRLDFGPEGSQNPPGVSTGLTPERLAQIQASERQSTNNYAGMQTSPVFNGRYQLAPQPASGYPTATPLSTPAQKGGGSVPVGNKQMSLAPQSRSLSGYNPYRTPTLGGNRGSYSSNSGGSSGGSNSPGGSDPNGGLGYSSQYSGLFQDLDRQQAMLGSNSQNYLNEIEAQYGRQSAESARMRDLALKNLEARMADQGILRSGINLGQQGEVGQEYQRMIDELNTGRAGAIAETQRNSAAGLAEIQFQREQLMFQQAQEAAQQAQEDAYRRAQAEAAANWVREQTGQLQPRMTPTGQYMSALSNYTAQNPREQGIMNMFAGMGVDPSQHSSGQQEDPIARIQRLAGSGRSLDDIRRSISLLLRGQ